MIKKEVLLELYIMKKKSCFQISKLLSENQGTIWYYLKKYNIKTRSKKEAHRLAFENNPELRKKVSISMKKIRKMSKCEIERRKKIGITVKKVWKTEEFRKKILPIRKTQWTKEVRKKISGENSSHWKGGKSFEEYGKEFNKELKEKVRKRDNYTCYECNQNEKQLGYVLSIHHIDFNKKNNLEENLISLCKSCHSKTNFLNKDWIKYYKNRMEERDIDATNTFFIRAVRKV